MFSAPKSSTTIEIQGCLYNFETPDSNIKIKFFQSGVGRDDANGFEFLKYLRPVRELLATNQIKDIRQLVQRELDDVRIIKSLIPYILNEKKIHGENGIAFFPSVLGVLMPKDYLSSLDKEYPSENIEKKIITKDHTLTHYESEGFNWSVKNYHDENGKPLVFSSLTVDRSNCDIVVIDGQHRINAFRAACGALTTDNAVIREIYDDCGSYPMETMVNLPITLIWFEKNEDSPNAEISPEIISRRLFIDVNNSAQNIASSRKILLDDRNPVNLITNHFYSKVADICGYVINELSLAHLGFDVPSETSQQTSFSSLPFTYITTPERLKYVFDNFFVRSKSYSIRVGIKSIDARKKSYSASINSDNPKTTELNIMLPNSSANSIAHYKDEYLETMVLFVNDDLTATGETKQDIVRNEFYNQYYTCFYKLLSEFRFFKEYIDKLSAFDLKIHQNGNVYEKDTWKSVFLEGKSLYFTLKNKSQFQNVFSETLRSIEADFINDNLNNNTYATFEPNNVVDGKELFNSFRTLVFQIGFVQSFYEYCKLIHSCHFETISSHQLNDYADEFLEKINEITDKEWANYFLFLRQLCGETHPKFFPAMTHLILRKIQGQGNIFDVSPDKKYFSPECFYFHEKSVESINNIIRGDFGAARIMTLKLDDLLMMNSNGTTYNEIFSNIIASKKSETESVFRDYLNIPTVYLDELFDELENDIFDKILVKR